MVLLGGHGSHVPTDFMFECKINKIKLVYLPPHSSHVLQHVSIFSLSTLHYRKEILSLTALEDVGPIKKQRFIDLHDSARRYALTPRNIQAGWPGAGLVPFNPQKVLASSQVQLSQPVPVTPRKRRRSNESILLRTP